MRNELNIQMPEPMHVSGPSYRMQRRPGMDQHTKRLVLIAGGIGAVLVLVLGAWQASNRHAGPVPVIEADSRPVRVKPENPGGMQVSGKDDAILSGDSSAKEGLAPAPETPEPQALKAEQPAPTATSPVVPAPPAAIPTAIPTPPTPPAASASAPSAPVVPSISARNAPVAVPAVPNATASGKTTVVQLAALPSEAGALAEWQRLSKRMPDLLGSRKPAVVKTSHDGKTFYRLRTSGFSTIADATNFCEHVRAKGGACSIATF